MAQRWMMWSTCIQLAYKLDCKGVTIYRDGTRDKQVLSTGKTEDKTPRAAGDEEKKVVKRERPKVLKGWTYQMQTGCGPLYVTVNQDVTGLFELFTTMGKAGGCAASQSEAIGRMGFAGLAHRHSGKNRSLNSSRESPVTRRRGLAKTRSFPVRMPSPKPFNLTWLPMASRTATEKVKFLKGACPDCGALLNMKGVALSAGHAATVNVRNAAFSQGKRPLHVSKKIKIVNGPGNFGNGFFPFRGRFFRCLDKNRNTPHDRHLPGG